jgi:hypothetical protein
MKGLRLFAIIASIALISSCKGFMDLAPISQISVGAFYKTQADFMQAVNGTYADLKGQYGYGYYSLFTDLRSDNTTMLGIGGGSEGQKIEIDNFSIGADNEHLLTYWTISYSTLQKANGVLSNIDGADFDQTLKDQYTGESKVIRALTYFNLVRMFGGVPIVTVGDVNIAESYDIPRSTVDEVYTLIVSDLTEAIPLLPATYSDDADVGRITKGAAQSILGEVYMTQHNYAAAATVLGSVISDGNYSLLSHYEDNFTGTDQGNSESVLAILFQGEGDNLGSNFPNHCAPAGSEGVLVAYGGAYGFDQPTGDIFNAYTAGDLRKAASIGVGFTTLGGTYVNARYIKLYVDQDPGDGYCGSDADWNVMRYAQVLLMYAEAVNEVGGPTTAAYDAINLVRDRAGLAPLSGLSESAFRDAVYLEERLEGAFEGHRWPDLVRTGLAVSTINAKLGVIDPVGPATAITVNQLIYPIPTDVILTSTPGVITQNP